MTVPTLPLTIHHSKGTLAISHSPLTKIVNSYNISLTIHNTESTLTIFHSPLTIQSHNTEESGLSIPTHSEGIMIEMERMLLLTLVSCAIKTQLPLIESISSRCSPDL